MKSVSSRREESRRSPTPGSEIWRRVKKRADGSSRDLESREEGEDDDPEDGRAAKSSASLSGDERRIRLRILGGAFLERDGRPETGRAARPYNLALLAYLAASPGRTASRDKVIACLWPDQNTSRARHRLSVALHVLRRELGAETIVSTGDSLTLDRDRVWVDLGAFRRAVHGGRLEEAVDLHPGPLLDGFYLSGARTFERWAEDERRSTERMYRSVLKTLVRESEEADRVRDAIRWYEELVSFEPLCARITMAFMKALARGGHVERAITRARAYATLVEAKLEIPPDPEVMALARDLVKVRQSESSESNRWATR